MENEPENLSAKQYITEAFLNLLGIKSFKTITVKEIVQKAGISRSTFYLHYRDKFDLLEYVDEQITSELLSFYGSHLEKDEGALPTIDATTIRICQHIYQYRSFYEHQFNHPAYVQKLADELAATLEVTFADKSYAIFASFGTIGYLTVWVKNQCKTSPKEAAQQLLTIGTKNWSVNHRDRFRVPE